MLGRNQVSLTFSLFSFILVLAVLHHTCVIQRNSFNYAHKGMSVYNVMMEGLVGYSASFCLYMCICIVQMYALH